MRERQCRMLANHSARSLLDSSDTPGLLSIRIRAGQEESQGQRSPVAGIRCNDCAPPCCLVRNVEGRRPLGIGAGVGRCGGQQRKQGGGRREVGRRRQAGYRRWTIWRVGPAWVGTTPRGRLASPVLCSTSEWLCRKRCHADTADRVVTASDDVLSIGTGYRSLCGWRISILRGLSDGPDRAVRGARAVRYRDENSQPRIAAEICAGWACPSRLWESPVEVTGIRRPQAALSV